MGEVTGFLKWGRETPVRRPVELRLQDLSLIEGTYLVDVAVHTLDGTPYDYQRCVVSFRMKSHVKDVGVYRPRHAWHFAGNLDLDPAPPRNELDLGDGETGP